MKPVQFHADAETEMIAATVYYESQQSALGLRFLASVQETINKIQIQPHLYPIIDRDVRRCLTKTFPFGVLYRDLPESIPIVAVMNLHRDPDYWKSR